MVRGVLAFGVFASLLLCEARVARAWTDAHVQTASAALVLSPEGALDVTLTVRVHVRGGWLESLEIAGLDPGLVLAEDRVVAVSDEGARVTGRASASEDGRVAIAFPRRDGPRRGHHTLVVRYRADLTSRFVPGELEHVRASWTFPGWQSGLDGVEVSLDAPRGARFVGEEDALVTLTRAREDHGERVTLRWRRAHLPRTLAWELGFELPRRSVAAHLGSSELPAPGPTVVPPSPTRAAARGDAPRVDTTFRVGPIFVGVVALLALFGFAFEARRRGVRLRFVVPMPLLLRAMLVLVGVAVALFVPKLSLVALAGVVFVVWPRGAEVRAARLGSWERVTSDEHRAAERASRRSRVGVSAWVDATGAAGLALFAVLFAAASRLVPLEPEELLLASVPPMLLTRHRLPSTAYERLLRLRAFAAELRASELAGLALQLAVHRDTHGVLQDARLRLVTASRAPGLLRLDLVATESARTTGLAPTFVGLVVTRESTPAERLVAAAFPELAVVRGPAGRLARFVDFATLVRVARVVDVEASRESRPSEAPTRARVTRDVVLHA